MTTCPNCGADLSESRKLVRTSAKELVETLRIDLALQKSIVKIAPNFTADEVEAALDDFKDRMRANGYRTNAGPVRDAHAAFRTHMRNAVKFSTRNTGTMRPAARTRPVADKKEL